MFQLTLSVSSMGLNDLERYLKQAINAKCAADLYMEVVYAASIRSLRTIALDQ